MSKLIFDMGAHQYKTKKYELVAWTASQIEELRSPDIRIYESFVDSFDVQSELHQIFLQEIKPLKFISVHFTLDAGKWTDTIWNIKRISKREWLCSKFLPI
jgi:hypothetical protein